MSVDPEKKESENEGTGSSENRHGAVSESPEEPATVKAVSRRHFSFQSALEPFVIQKRAPATLLILIINILVFVAMAVATRGASILVPSIDMLHLWGASFGPLSLDAEPFRIATAMFLHIGFLHLVINMVVLYGFGSLTERLFGTTSFVLIYMLSGLAGSCLSLILTPAVTAAGASGAIFGVIGAMSALFHKYRKGLKPAEYKQGVEVMVLLIVITLISGFFYNFDNGAHFGGLIAGFISGFLFYPMDSKFSFVRNFFSLIFMSCLVTGLFKLAQTTPLDFDGVYRLQRAHYLFEKNKVSDVSNFIDEYIKENPASKIGFLLKGSFLQDKQNFSQASEYFSKAINLDPKNGTLYAQRANCYLLDGELDKAIDDCLKAESLGEKSVGVYQVKMMALGQSGRLKEALEVCNKLLSMKSDKPDLFLMDRSHIYYLMGERDEALLDINTVIEKHPSSLRAIANRLYLYFESGRMKEVGQELDKLEAIKDPKSEFDYVARAYACLAFERYKQSIADGLYLADNSETRKQNAYYGALVGKMASEFGKDWQSDKRIGQLVSKLEESRAWPYPIYLYLNSEISRQELFGIAGENRNKLTEMKVFLALECEMTKEFDKAKEHYRWVIEKGNPFFLEWQLAKVRIAKLDQIQSDIDSSLSDSESSHIENE